MMFFAEVLCPLSSESTFWNNHMVREFPVEKLTAVWAQNRVESLRSWVKLWIIFMFMKTNKIAQWLQKYFTHIKLMGTVWFASIYYPIITREFSDSPVVSKTWLELILLWYRHDVHWVKFFLSSWLFIAIVIS